MKKLLLNVIPMALLVTAFGFLNAQTTNVLQGSVKDSKKSEAIIGAAVQVKGTNIGAVTDADGKFAIAVPANAKTLVVKYLGYKAKEVDVTKGDFNVSLDEDILGLEEIVVTAIGIKKEKRALGYSVQDVNGSDLTKAGNPNAFTSLSGKVAGLQATSANGAPGGGVNLRLRGPTSLFNGNNQPLIVVDGIPIDNDQESSIDNIVYGGQYGGINGDFNQNRAVDINPEDIENISVLKGGASAALYGSQGQNGVILITTKKGTVTGGKQFKVDVSTTVTFDQVNKLPELQNQWVQGTKNGFTPYATRSWGAKGDTLAWDGFSGTGGINPNTGIPYDANDSAWDSHGTLVSKNDPTAKTPFKPYENEKSFFKTGVTASNSFAISGGSDKGVFRFGITNLYQTGIIPLSKLNKTTVTLSGEAKIGAKASISGSASYTNSANDGNLQGNNTSGIMYGVYRTPISFDNRNGITNSFTDPAMFTSADGHQRSYTYYYGRDLFGDGLSVFENPYRSINQNPYNSQVNRMMGNVQLNADPTSWLSFLGRVGADVYSDRRRVVFGLEAAATPEGQIIEDQHFNRIINSDVMATFHHEWEKGFNGSIFIGNNVFSSYYQNLNTLGDGLSFPGFYNLSNAQTIISGESKSRELRTAIYGGLNFDYKSQIYFAFTARNEWSSTLPAAHRSYFYPSVSAGWVFTETAKLSNNKWFPYGKLRLSWAQVGKGASPYLLKNYYYQPVISDQSTAGVSFPFNGLGGFLLSQNLGNPNLKPELTNTYEAGLDLRFMQTGIKVFGGFGIDFTYYYMKTKDEIITVPVSPSSGFAGAVVNAGSIQNQGFEIMASITPVKVKDFRWDMTVNWSKNISKVLSLYNNTKSILIGGFDGAAIQAVAGQPYGMIWGGDWVRDNNGKPIIDDQQTINGGANPHYGLPIARADVGLADTIIGNPNPKWLMGWRNTFTWKGLSLSFLFDIKHGGDIHNGTRGALVTYGKAKETENRDDIITYDGVKGHQNPDGSFSTTGANDILVNLGAVDPSGTGKTFAQEWYSDGNGGGFGNSNRQFVEDGSFFRMRELSLSYSLDKKLFKKILKGLDLSFVARNVFLVTKYKGIDPDQSLAGASNQQGLEWFNLPSTRSYGFSVKFHF